MTVNINTSSYSVQNISGIDLPLASITYDPVTNSLLATSYVCLFYSLYVSIPVSLLSF